MFADYLTRGVKAGLVAGLVLGLFMAVVANPLVGYADQQNHAASESGHAEGEHAESAHAEGGQDADSHAGDSHASGGHEDGGHAEPAVSMAVNKTVSVVSSGLWAVLLGGLVFGFAFYLLEPAIPGTGATKSYVLAGAGFVTVSGAPWLVLPPAAPGAQQSLAVTPRLLLYGGMMVAGAIACLLAGYAYNRISTSRNRPLAIVTAVVPFGLLVIPAVLAPTNVIGGALAPGLRTGLLGLTVFGQLLLWLVLAATHAQFRQSDSVTGLSSSDRGPVLTAD